MKFLALLASVVLSFFPTQTSQIVGSAVPSTPALIDTYLATNIDNSQTSMTLANGLTRAGTALSGYMCFVIDINSPTTEYVCGTASSTSITSLSRGVDVLNPNSTSSALAYPHRRFASVQISDYPTLQVLVRKVNGTDTWDSKITYTTAPTFSNGNDIINKTYADNLAIAGAPNGSTIQKGIYQEASTTNIGNGTAVGSTGADLIVPNSYFHTTSSATTTVPVTNSSGTLSQGFLDLTQAFTFSGGVTSTATTSLTGTTNVSGQLNVTGNPASFTQIPTTTTTSPTSTNQLTTKGYTDLTYPSFISSSSISALINSGTISSISATTTVPTNARYGVVVGNLSTTDNNSITANFQLTMEILRQGVSVTQGYGNISSGGGSMSSMSASISNNIATITMTGNVVSTASHNYTLSGTIYWF